MITRHVDNDAVTSMMPPDGDVANVWVTSSMTSVYQTEDGSSPRYHAEVWGEELEAALWSHWTSCVVVAADDVAVDGVGGVGVAVCPCNCRRGGGHVQLLAPRIVFPKG